MALTADKLRQGAAGVSTGGYDIDNSLRFNDNDSAYLSRTTSSSSTTWTISMWVKQGNITSSNLNNCIFSAKTSNFSLFFESHELRIWENGGNGVLYTTQLFRDPSAWYHIVVKRSTVSPYLTLYVNGSEVTDFSRDARTTYAGTTNVNQGDEHIIGGWNNGGYKGYDGYLAEVHFIDGTALDPTSFGETGDYGEWKAKKVSGLTYGTNGFYLDFKTSGTLGNDANGSNNWTTNNLASTDQMLDTPTNNFATMNPIDHTGFTFYEGNLKVTTPSSGVHSCRASMSLSSGKYYWEVVVIAQTGGPVPLIGIYGINVPTAIYVDSQPTGYLYYGNNGNKLTQGSNVSYGASYTVGDIIGVSFDSDSGVLIFYKNGVSQGTAFTVSTSITYSPVLADGSGSNTETYVVNFGQDSSFAGNKTAQSKQDSNSIGDFYYEPPSGFLALCTKNLPDPAVIPSEHFNTVLWTGNGSTQSITGVGFEPSLVWGRGRSYGYGLGFFDQVRGATKTLNGYLPDAEYTQSGLTSFDSDGFSLGSTWGNISGRTQVAWNWKANGSGAANTSGSINSTVSVNADAGFSIVKYTGDGVTGATIGHGLSSAPEMVIVKDRSVGSNWAVQSVPLCNSVGNGAFMELNTTSAYQSGSNPRFNSTLPTSDVFSARGYSGSSTNNNTDTYIAYCFHSVDGYSKVGSYTGNGSADGTFVYTGFRVAYILIKKTAAAAWPIIDDKRENKAVFAHSSQAEQTHNVDLLSNGFKLRTTDGNFNSNGGTFIYLAFAESPFKHTNAR